MSTQRGVTLIELMTVLVIAAILAMVAMPSFVNIFAAQKVKTTASNLQTGLLITRSEGLKRNANVRLAPVNGTQWNSGWNVVNVADNVVISTYPAVPALAISGPDTVTYQASGRITATASPTFRISSNSSDIRCITISLTGVPSVSSSGC